VRLLAGVGDRLGERLEAIGYDKAYTVLGQVSDPSDRCYHFLNIFAQKGLTLIFGGFFTQNNANQIK
jgi:hypothetical protein